MDYGQQLHHSPIASIPAESGTRWSFLGLVSAIEHRYGWLVLTLAAIISFCTPLAIDDIQWLDNVGVLYPTAALAALAGVAFSARRGKRIVDISLGVLLGSAGIFLVLGRILPTWRRVWENSQAVVAWGTQVFTGQVVANPFPHMLGVAGQRLISFILQIISWWSTGGSGQPEIDNRIFLFLLAVVTWSITFYMTWALYRGINAIAAITPLGVVLITLVVLGGQGTRYVVVFLICAFLLVMRLHILSLQQIWDRRKVDYPSSVAIELFITGAVFTALIAVLAMVLPSAPQNVIAVKFWAFFNGPWSTVEANVGEAFTGVRHKVGGNAGTDLFLGGSISTRGNTIVMYVTTDEPAPPDLPEEQLQAMGYAEPVHYFRGVAFTQYDGHGWGNTGKVKARSHYGVAIGPDGEPVYQGMAPAPQERIEERLPTQPINALTQGAERVMQQVEQLQLHGNLMYAYDVPVQLDQPYTVHSVGGAQTRVDLKGSSKKYTVVSEVLTPTAPQLRTAPTNYPDWVETYRALPAVPGRVTDLAKQWTANAGNPYDRVMAIQENLRRIPYSTDVVAPPGGRDAVDYFLFDQKQGYCEYYASAMVVMARSVGVPARVASGYATTLYNRTKAAYEVDEADAHTWVQVYFQGIGWVDFEPTPINPALTRPEGAGAEGEQAAPVVESPKPVVVAPRRVLPFDSRILVAAVVVVLLLFLAYAIRRQWEAELTANAMIALVYGRLCRQAGWYGQRRLAHETPLEYGYRVADRFALVAEPVADQIRRIVVLYVMSQYAQQPLGEPEKQEAKKAWRVIRSHLWQLRRARRIVPQLDAA